MIENLELMKYRNTSIYRSVERKRRRMQLKWFKEDIIFYVSIIALTALI